MNDDEILIEDKYGKDRNINDLLSINDIIPNKNPEEIDFSINDSKDSNLTTFDEFKLPIKKDKQEIIKKIPQETKNFIWYLKNSYLALIFIILLNISSLVFYNRFPLLDSLRFILEIFIFVVLSNYIIKIKDESPKISAIICAFVGFVSGFFITLFKIFYLMKFWTIFNFLTEIEFLVLEGFVIGIIFGGLFYTIDKSLKHKYGNIK